MALYIGLSCANLRHNMVTGLDKAIEIAGSSTELARMLGISQSAVIQWGGKPPILRCPEIEKLTGIKCSELRPDFFKRAK